MFLIWLSLSFIVLSDVLFTREENNKIELEYILKFCIGTSPVYHIAVCLHLCLSYLDVQCTDMLDFLLLEFYNVMIFFWCVLSFRWIANMLLQKSSLNILTFLLLRGDKYVFFFFLALEQEMQNSNRKSDIEGLRTSVFSLSVVL